MSGIAFFDLDRTLLSVNSATGWVRRELRLGHISRRDAARAVGWISLYHLGFGRMERVIEDAVSTMAGVPERDLVGRTLDFWQQDVAGMVRPGAYAALARHRERGDHLAVLTSSSDYLGGAAARALDIPHVLSNRFEVVDGRFTGRLHYPLCFGAGKVDHARGLAAQLNVPLERCAFYTDSHSDLPAMELVGDPVAVHPDPRLARVAKARGWRIEDWSEA